MVPAFLVLPRPGYAGRAFALPDDAMVAQEGVRPATGLAVRFHTPVSTAAGLESSRHATSVDLPQICVGFSWCKYMYQNFEVHFDVDVGHRPFAISRSE